MFILKHNKITFYALVSRHIMKRYLGLESKSLGGCLAHLALALIALVSLPLPSRSLPFLSRPLEVDPYSSSSLPSIHM